MIKISIKYFILVTSLMFLNINFIYSHEANVGNNKNNNTEIIKNEAEEYFDLDYIDDLSKPEFHKPSVFESYVKYYGIEVLQFYLSVKAWISSKLNK